MATFNVSNASGLTAALRSANGGDTILLKGGNYGRVELNGKKMPDLKFSKEVTIASADQKNPAVFNELSVLHARNITFDGLHYENLSRSVNDKSFQISRSSDITIENGTFEGQVAKGYGSGRGLWVAESSNVVLQNSTFSDFWTATQFGVTKGLKIIGNEIHDSALDAMILGQVENVLIQGNLVDKKGSPDTEHKDAIQFWNDKVNAPSKNVVIRNNELLTDDRVAHGIYFGNEWADKTGSKSAFHQNVLIENNKIVSGQVLGIAAGQTDGLTIRNNVVLQNPDVKADKLTYVPAIRFHEDSDNVVITGNTGHFTPVAAGDNWQPTGASDGSWKISANTIVPIGTKSGFKPPSTESREPDQPIVVKPSEPARPSEPAKPPVDGNASGNGKADTFRIDGDDRSKTVSGLDFGEGDRIVLIDYDKNTIQHDKGGNLLWRSLDGTYAVIDSAADLKELASASPGISSRTASDGSLIVTVDQKWGDQQITIKGAGGGAATGPSASAKAASVPEASATAAAAPVQKAASGVSGNGKKDTVRIDGDDRSKVLTALDFDEGDRFVLIDYDKDTLRHDNGGNALWRSLDGTYAVIDSLTDVQELVAMSPDVTARRGADDTLVLSIDQKWGTQEIGLRGHAADYYDSFDSALF